MKEFVKVMMTVLLIILVSICIGFSVGFCILFLAGLTVGIYVFEYWHLIPYIICFNFILFMLKYKEDWGNNKAYKFKVDKEIDSCISCPVSTVCSNSLMCSIKNKTVHEVRNRPNWCPLEEAK